MIVFVGPLPEPVTGQSLAFDIISRRYKKKKKVFYYGASNQNKLLIFSLTLITLIKFIFFLITQRDTNTMYLTTSRTIFGFFRDALFILTSKFFSINVVNHLHGADFIEFRSNLSPFLKNFVDYVYSKIDTSIVLLPKMKEQYKMYKSMNVLSISNCALPINNFTRNNSDSLEILYLSNIMYSKGVLLLIEAVDNLIMRGANIHLSIAGSPIGDEYKSANEIESIFRNSIQDRPYIRYYGSVFGERKEQLLIDSDVFVLPSFYKTEAQPISIIEAMLSGSVIITTNHNYLSDMIDFNNGFIIKPRSVSAIESSILELVNDKEKLQTMSDYNKNYAKKNYSVEQYVKEISAVLDSFPLK